MKESFSTEICYKCKVQKLAGGMCGCIHFTGNLNSRVQIANCNRYCKLSKEECKNDIRKYNRRK